MNWQHQMFPSGTQIVIDMDTPDPHFYIYGPGNADEDHADADRSKVCKDIVDYLNGGSRPKWLDDMVRVSEEHAIALDGTSITATGPSIDSDPPNLCWVQDDSDEAHDARARLMDRLFLVNPQEVVK